VRGKGTKLGKGKGTKLGEGIQDLYVLDYYHFRDFYARDCFIWEKFVAPFVGLNAAT